MITVCASFVVTLRVCESFQLSQCVKVFDIPVCESFVPPCVKSYFHRCRLSRHDTIFEADTAALDYTCCEDKNSELKIHG